MGRHPRRCFLSVTPTLQSEMRSAPQHLRRHLLHPCPMRFPWTAMGGAQEKREMAGVMAAGLGEEQRKWTQ